MYALVWHDLHTDAEVYIYPNEHAAQAGAILHLIDYLAAYVERLDRVSTAEQLADLFMNHSLDIAYEFACTDDLIADLDYLYWHVTEAKED